MIQKRHEKLFFRYIYRVNMSIILGKYKNKRKLGKGAYGDVLLVEDSDGSEWAIKMISKKILERDSFMSEYLEGEKECMMSVKSQYVMRLHGFEEDQHNIYFICEYCDGGDLLNFQAKQPNKVFELGKATKILSEVIHGLELLHSLGYLHRDIKPQNILLKKHTDGQYIQHYKLADFGFAKKNEDVGGTVLGTENYMSPEIYLQESYSYQVDMWAFGVVFYFMLNLQFPFKTNPHCKDMDQKRDDLIKQAKCFKYSEAVAKSKKKRTENCTSQMDDLFIKIFDIDPNNRITFSQIRQHPIFKPHFPTVSETSKILYKKGNKKPISRLDSFIMAKTSGVQRKPVQKPKKKEDEEQNVQPSLIVKRAKGKQFTEQKNYLDLEYDKIKFLAESENQMVETSSIMEAAEILMIRYCLWKYYIVLLRDFIASLTPPLLEKKIPLKWKEYYKTPTFKKQVEEYEGQLYKAELKLTQTYDSCSLRLVEIKKINPSFQAIFESEVTDKDFSGNLKDAYRCSTGLAYSKLRQVFKNGNKYVYLTTIATLCHAFNKIVEADQAELKKLFANYIEAKDLSDKQFDFTAFRSWLSNQRKENLKPIITNTFKTYFGG